MGFDHCWIRGTTALYSNAHNKVLCASDNGNRFKMSRSVRQGCPLAPYLFLLFVETMHSFLQSSEAMIQGLYLQEADAVLLDSEFADDAMIYLKGALKNLMRAQSAIEIFCQASGPRINWNKSKAFWITLKPIPPWKPTEDFQWVPTGTMV